MEFTTEQENGYVFIRLRGEMTGSLDDAPLHDCIKERLTEGCRIFIVNVGAVTTIDSLGIGWLVVAHELVKDAGGRLVLCQTEHIHAMFTFSHLERFITFFATEAEATQALLRSQAEEKRAELTLIRSQVRRVERKESDA